MINTSSWGGKSGNNFLNKHCFLPDAGFHGDYSRQFRPVQGCAATGVGQQRSVLWKVTLFPCSWPVVSYLAWFQTYHCSCSLQEWPCWTMRLERPHTALTSCGNFAFCKSLGPETLISSPRRQVTLRLSRISSLVGSILAMKSSFWINYLLHIYIYIYMLGIPII